MLMWRCFLTKYIVKSTIWINLIWRINTHEHWNTNSSTLRQMFSWWIIWDNCFYRHTRSDPDTHQLLWSEGHLGLWKISLEAKGAGSFMKEKWFFLFPHFFHYNLLLLLSFFILHMTKRCTSKRFSGLFLVSSWMIPHFKHRGPSLARGNTLNCFVLFPSVIS